MKRRTRLVFPIPILILLLCNFAICPAVAQNPQLQQRVADIKEATARNRQALAQYTWVEQVTISLKGEEKKQEHFQVQLGADGKQQKTSLDPPPPPPSADSGGRGGRLKQRVVEKKTEDYKEYADQIRALIQQYVPPDKEMLEQAYQKGNVKLSDEVGSPGQYRLLISNYVKNGDSMALIVDQTQRDLAGISINSYLDDPKNAVTVNVQFSAMPGGPNHVSAETINGVSKQLTINIQNSNYQRL